MKPLMRVDPRREALRLLEVIDPYFLGDLAADPRNMIELLFEGLTVSTRPPSPPGAGCAVDGTYRPGPRRGSWSPTMSRGRGSVLPSSTRWATT